MPFHQCCQTYEGRGALPLAKQKGRRPAILALGYSQPVAKILLRKEATSQESARAKQHHKCGCDPSRGKDVCRAERSGHGKSGA